MELPKFDPSLKDSNESSSVFSKMGSAKERPIGQKAAKKIERDEKSAAAYYKIKLKNSIALSKSMEKLAQAHAQKEKRQYLLSMFQVAKEIHDEDMMQDYISQLKALKEEELKPEAMEVEEDEKPEAMEGDDMSSSGLFLLSSTEEQYNPNTSDDDSRVNQASV